MAFFKKFGGNKKKDSTISYNVPSKIGEPYDVEHKVHVGFDRATGTFRGLPEPWLRLIDSSDITYVRAFSFCIDVTRVFRWRRNCFTEKDEM